MRFLISTLGQDWAKREILADTGYLMLGENAPETPDSDLVRTHRLITLALELEAVRDVAGFADLLAQLQQRSMYEAVAEMRAVRLMQGLGTDIEFINPNAHEGRSFDAAMTIDGVRVAVEVKAKLPAPVHQYSPTALTNALTKARKQLPSEGPGLIYLQIPHPWSATPEVLDSAQVVILRWLSNTSRVNAVVVMLERWAPREVGHRFSSAHVELINPRPRRPLAAFRA